MLEVVIKIMALGFLNFIQDGFHIFELFVSVGSLVEISYRNDISIISILRSLRVLRYLNNEYGWNSFRILVLVIFEGVNAAAAFFVILGFYIYMFAIIGMKYFAGQFKFDMNGYPYSAGISPRANFDTLKEAYTTVFQVLLGENFNEVVFSAIRGTGWTSVIYFMALVITGKFLLLQMYLAVILGQFESAREKTSFKHITAKAFITRIFRQRHTKKYDNLQTNGHRHQGKLNSLVMRHQQTLKEASEHQGY